MGLVRRYGVRSYGGFVMPKIIRKCFLFTDATYDNRRQGSIIWTMK